MCYHGYATLGERQLLSYRGFPIWRIRQVGHLKKTKRFSIPLRNLETTPVLPEKHGYLAAPCTNGAQMIPILTQRASPLATLVLKPSLTNSKPSCGNAGKSKTQPLPSSCSRVIAAIPMAT